MKRLFVNYAKVKEDQLLPIYFGVLNINNKYSHSIIYNSMHIYGDINIYLKLQETLTLNVREGSLKM